jgi:hypothetical protein
MATRRDQTTRDEDPNVRRRSPGDRAKRIRRQSYPDLTDYIRQLVDEAPPLDEEQRARLGRILRAHIPKQRTELPRDAAA